MANWSVYAFSVFYIQLYLTAIVPPAEWEEKTQRSKNRNPDIPAAQRILLI
jgi:hypothetical protein